GDENVMVAKASCRLPDDIGEPTSGIWIPLDYEIFLADHVREDHGFHTLQVSRNGHPSGEFAAAVGVVVILIPIDERLLAIQKRDPDGVRLLLGAEQARHLKHESGGGAAVLGADEF